MLVQLVSVSLDLSSLNYVVVSRSRKFFNVNSSEIAAEYLKMFGVSDYRGCKYA